MNEIKCPLKNNASLPGHFGVQTNMTRDHALHTEVTGIGTDKVVDLNIWPEIKCVINQGD